VSEIVKALTDSSVELVHAHGAGVVLLNEGHSETVFLHDDRVMLPQSSKPVLQALASKQIQLSHSNVDMVLDNATAAQCGWSRLTINLIQGRTSEPFGTLLLGDHRPLNATQTRTLDAMCTNAAAALENARLFSRITQSSRQWAEIFDSLTDFVVLHDNNDRVVRVNRPFAEHLGTRPVELLGLPMRDLFAGGESLGLQPCPLCVLDRTENGLFQLLQDRAYLVSTSRIHGAINEGMQTIHVLKDVTERREAERRYRELFDTIQEGAYFSSPEGRFIEVNDAMVRLLGYGDREQVLALDIGKDVYASREERDRILNLLEAGPLLNKEVCLRRKDGSVVFALENSVTVRDGENKILQYRGLILDITEAKRFQSQLQRERDFNRQIINTTQSLILVVDTAGLISFANARCMSAPGLQNTKLIGSRIAEIFNPADRQVWEDAFESSLNGTVVNNVELHARGAGPGLYSANLGPMADDQGQVTSVVVIMTDITDLSIIQAKLMSAEKLAAVGQLVSGVAHEVNNPLTAIVGFADLLMENPEVPESARKDLQVVLHEAERTKGIVRNLLSFARQTPTKREPIDVNAVVRRTLALRAYDLERSGIKLIQEYAVVPEFLADPHQLQQVFLNILNNAFDAVRESRNEGRIAVSTAHIGNFAEIAFTDSGTGIARPERIFDPFFTTKPVGKGTGLGLSICYGIVKEHRGEITCSNNEGPGAKFVIRLPIARASAASAGCV